MDKDNPVNSILQALNEAKHLQIRSHNLVIEAEKALSRLSTNALVNASQAAAFLNCTKRNLYNLSLKGQLTPRNADGSLKTTAKNTHTYYQLQEIWKLLNQ